MLSGNAKRVQVSVSDLPRSTLANGLPSRDVRLYLLFLEPSLLAIACSIDELPFVANSDH